MWNQFTNFLKSSKKSKNSGNNNNVSIINTKSVTAVGGEQNDYTDTYSEDSFHSAPSHLKGYIREDVLPSHHDRATASVEQWLDSLKVQVEPLRHNLGNPASHCIRVSKSRKQTKSEPYTIEKVSKSSKKRERKRDRAKKIQNDFSEISEEEKLLIQNDTAPYSHKKTKGPHYTIVNAAVREYLTRNPPPIKDMRLILKNLRDTSLIQDRLTVEQEAFVAGLIRKILNNLTIYMTYDVERLDNYFSRLVRRRFVSVHLPACYYGDTNRLKLHAPDIGHYELFKIVRHFDSITNATAKRKSEQLLLKTGIKPKQPVIRLCDPANPECTEDIVLLQKMELEKKEMFSGIKRPRKRLLQKITEMKNEKYKSFENTASRLRYKSHKHARKLDKEIEEMYEQIERRTNYLGQIHSREGKTTAQSKPTSHTSSGSTYHSTAPTTTIVEPVEPVELSEPAEPAEPLNLWRPRPPPTSAEIISQNERCTLIDIPSTASSKRSNSPNITTVDCVSVPNISATSPWASHVPTHMLESKKSITELCSIESSGGECRNLNCRFSHFRDFSHL